MTVYARVQAPRRSISSIQAVMQTTPPPRCEISPSATPGRMRHLKGVGGGSHRLRCGLTQNSIPVVNNYLFAGWKRQRVIHADLFHITVMGPLCKVPIFTHTIGSVPSHQVQPTRTPPPSRPSLPSSTPESDSDWGTKGPFSERINDLVKNGC